MAAAAAAATAVWLQPRDDGNMQVTAGAAEERLYVRLRPDDGIEVSTVPSATASAPTSAAAAGGPTTSLASAPVPAAAVAPTGWPHWAEPGHVVAHSQLALPRPPANWTPPPPPGSEQQPQQGPSDGVAAAALQQQPSAVVVGPAAALLPRPLHPWLLPPPPVPPFIDSGGGPFGALGGGVGSFGTYPLEAWRQDNGDIMVSGPRGLAAVISGTSGCLAGLSLCGQPLMASQLTPALWRAYTDNDRGGSRGTSYAARWTAAGLDRLQSTGEESWVRGAQGCARHGWGVFGQKGAGHMGGKARSQGCRCRAVQDMGGVIGQKGAGHR